MAAASMVMAVGVGVTVRENREDAEQALRDREVEYLNCRLVSSAEDCPDDPTPTTGPTTTFVDPGEPVEPTCPEVDGSSPRRVNFSESPPMCIDPTREHRALVRTNLGDFNIKLDTAAAPLAVNNFVFLALWQYYDGVAFHRVVPDFVIQAGDATGRGTECDDVGCGDAGYEFEDELPTGEPPFYPLMSVAMANSGPDANGSQFFVVVGPEGEQLPPNYTRFGSVVSGRWLIEEIEATGDPSEPDGVPTELTVIENIIVWAQGPFGEILDP